MRPQLVTERDVQRTIVEGLRAMGYTVLETSRRNHMEACPRCGESFRSHKWAGGDKGLPDLIVTRESWPGVWLGIEVKGPATRVSPEQLQLVDSGRIVIVRSWEEAVEAVRSLSFTFARMREHDMGGIVHA